MKGIAGEEKLRSAAAKLKQQVGTRVDGLCSVADDFSIRQLNIHVIFC
jgi:hypothetical protein